MEQLTCLLPGPAWLGGIGHLWNRTSSVSIYQIQTRWNWYLWSSLSLDMLYVNINGSNTPGQILLVSLIQHWKTLHCKNQSCVSPLKSTVWFQKVYTSWNLLHSQQLQLWLVMKILNRWLSNNINSSFCFQKIFNIRNSVLLNFLFCFILCE